MPKISELPLANKLKEEDYIPIVQDGVTKKVKGTHFVTEEEYSLDAFSPTIAANDKAMYKFGEGDTVDFSDSAYDGAYKSAILKGQTLVNTITNVEGQHTWATVDNITFTHIKDSVGFSFINYNCSLKPNTKYFIRFEYDYAGNENLTLQFGFRTNLGAWDSYSTTLTKGVNKATLTTNGTSNNLSVIIMSGQTLESASFGKLMVIEYQEGMENWDIPYFEGIQSVRMPVLTTTSKNLWNNYALERGSINHLNGGNLNQYTTQTRSKDYIPIVQNTKYIATSYGVDGTTSSDLIRYYDSEKKFIGTSPNEKSTFLRTVFQMDIDNISHIQLEQGAVATPYEPYKSNILSTPSDLELRGIGDVQDTLDLLTGELKENFVAISCNGTEDWRGDSTIDNIRLAYILPSIREKSGGKVICDKLPTIANNSKSVGVRLSTSGGLYIQIDASLGISVKEWLTSNEINIIYEKRDELKVVKTVGLSGTPFGYKGGHIIKSSAEGSLLPKFEYEVAVSRGAQISQNTSTLIKHDEKITELLKKTAATYINQKAEIAYLLNMSSTLEEVQTIPFIEDDYVNDDCMVDSDMVMDNMEVEPEKEIIDNVDTLLINLIYDLIELNDTLDLSEKVELFRQSGLIDKHNYEIIKEKLNPTFKEEDYADINQ